MIGKAVFLITEQYFTFYFISQMLHFMQLHKTDSYHLK